MRIVLDTSALVSGFLWNGAPRRLIGGIGNYHAEQPERTSRITERITAAMMPLPIERWHTIVKTRDVRGLDALLADGVIFQSPVVHTPQVGKAITQKYLAAAMSVLNNGTFEYLNEWYGRTSAVLEFQCTCESVVINGVDMIEWDADGRISNFKVMVRPLKAINTLHAMMGKLLQRAE